MKALDAPGAIHKRQNRHFVTRFTVKRERFVAVLFQAIVFGAAFAAVVAGAVVGFVNFHNATIAAHRGKIARSHRFANAVRHEPCSFQGHTKNAVQLIAADSLLAAYHEVDCLKPYVHRYMAGLKNGANLYSKWLAAFIALVGADSGGFPAHLRNALTFTTLGAGRTMRPNTRFNISVGGFFVVKMFFRKV